MRALSPRTTFIVAALAVTHCLAHAASAQGVAGKADAPPLLKLNKAVERRVAGGDRHPYRVVVGEGHFIHLKVEQRGVDVVLLFYGPDGRELLHLDTPNGLNGPETLDFIAERAGEYQLVVTPLDKNAQAGSYRLRLEESRGRRRDDYVRVARQQAIVDAAAKEERATELVKQKQYAEAEAPLQEAAALRRGLPGQPYLSRPLYGLAGVYEVQGKNEQALRAYEEALPHLERDEGRDSVNVGFALFKIGRYYLTQNDLAQAEPKMRRALEILSMPGRVTPDNMMVMRQTLGYLYKTQRQFAEAETQYLRALDMAVKFKGTAESAEALYLLSELGAVHLAREDFPRAAETLQNALALGDKVKVEPALTATVMLNLAIVRSAESRILVARGVYDEAERRSLVALDLMKRIPEEVWKGSESQFWTTRAQMLNGLGEVYAARTDFKRKDAASAAEAFREAAALCEKSLPVCQILADVSANLGSALKNAREYAQAEKALRRALDLFKSDKAPQEKLFRPTYLLGQLHLRLSNYTLAEPLLLEARRIAAESPPMVAEIDTHLGELYAGTGDFARAEESLRRTLSFHEKEEADSFAVAAACMEVGEMYEAKGDFAGAESFYNRAIGIYRRKIPSGGKLSGAHVHLSNPLTLLALMHIKRGSYQRAEQIIEELRGLRELSKGVVPFGLTFANFGATYGLRGQFARAEALLQEALSDGNHEEFETPGILDHLGSLYTSKAEYARAEEYLKRSLALRESQGRDSLDITYTLFFLADLYRQQGRLGLAMEQADRLLSLYEKQYGPDHVEVAKHLHSVAVYHLAANNYGRAEALGRRELAIQEKLFGPESLEAAEALNHLCVLYGVKMDFSALRPFRERAVAIFEKRQREKPLDTMKTSTLAMLYLISFDREELDKGIRLLLESLARDEREGGVFVIRVTKKFLLGQFYGMVGDFPGAERAYRDAVSIAEQSSGPEGPAVAQPLKLLADYFVNMADFAEAERLYARVLKLQTQLFGPEHPGVAETLMAIGTLERTRGDYVKPEESFRRALKIRTAAFGPTSQPVLELQVNLADLYRDRGEYDRAERLYLEALSTAEKSTGANSMPVLLAHHGLGLLYRNKEEYDRAETHFLKAQHVAEITYGPMTFMSWGAQIIPARMYLQQGNYLKAQALLKQLLSFRGHSIAWNDLSDSYLRINLAETYRYQGAYAEAAALTQEALTLREGLLGHEHPDTILALEALADTRQAQGELREAVRLRTLAAERGEKNITRSLASGSERQKSQLLATFGRSTDAIVSLHLRAAPANADARRLALTTVLRRKGRALDIFSDQIAALRRHATPEDKLILDRLAAASTRWTHLIFRSSAQAEAAPQPGTVSKFEREISELDEEVQQLEAVLSTRSAQFRTQTQAVTIDAVRGAIPADAALVEFVAYRPYDPLAAGYKNRFGPTRYAAYVLTRDGAEPGFVELGEAAPIDAQALEWRSLLGRRASERQIKQIGGILYQKLFAPLTQLLGGRRRVLLVPDGNLNLIQFAALTDEKGSYLIREYDLSYLTSGRELLRVQEELPAEAEDLVIADPTFDLTRPFNRCPPGTAVVTQFDFTGRCYSSLPGTAHEATALSQLLPGAQFRTGSDATESRVKAASRPRLLHVATHGFFWPDRPAANGLKDTERAGLSGSQLVNPMIRSGLYLAGVKQAKSGAGEDGVLTAQEVAGLNLWGTKLVVLSACETALGDTRNGQGVYGLRRALVLAGSETQMMSLWKVSDDATRTLMVAYYSRLQAGKGRAGALREVQLAMLRGELTPASAVANKPRSTSDTAGDDPKTYRHPYYWAAFILSGEWRSLDGREK